MIIPASPALLLVLASWLIGPSIASTTTTTHVNIGLDHLDSRREGWMMRGDVPPHPTMTMPLAPGLHRALEILHSSDQATEDLLIQVGCYGDHFSLVFSVPYGFASLSSSDNTPRHQSSLTVKVLLFMTLVAFIPGRHYGLSGGYAHDGK